jgi:carbon storage regulator
VLALTRKKGEAIIINNNIELTILEVRGDQIKIGISAPREIPVYRKEVYLQIEAANKEAMSAPVDVEALKNLLK